MKIDNYKLSECCTTCLFFKDDICEHEKHNFVPYPLAVCDDYHEPHFNKYKKIGDALSKKL